MWPEPCPLLRRDLWEEEKEGWGEEIGLRPIDALPGLPALTSSSPELTLPRGASAWLTDSILQIMDNACSAEPGLFCMSVNKPTTVCAVNCVAADHRQSCTQQNPEAVSTTAQL